MKCTEVVCLPHKEILIINLRSLDLFTEMDVMEKIIDPIANACSGSKMSFEQIHDLVKPLLFERVSFLNYIIDESILLINALKIANSIFTSQTPFPYFSKL